MYETPEKQEADAKAAPLKSFKWMNEIESANKNKEKWVERAQDIVKRYLDRRDRTEEQENRLNLFTTNTNILMSTLYARIPKPLVTREFEDQDDDIARVASMIIERCLKVRQGDDFDCAIRYVVQDRLVPGLGVCWARYEPTYETQMTEPVIGLNGEVIEEPEEVEVLVSEKIHTDYVFWEDIIWCPARVWEDISWIGRRVRMSKEDAKKRFGEVIAERLNYEEMEKATDANGEKPHSKKKLATIYEIWDKLTKKVYWISKGVDYILDVKDDFLGLKDFFPCPRFLTAMMSTSNYMPRPDYLMAQDQYRELDEVNNRIVRLEQAIRAVGVYDGNNTELERIFTEGADNKLYPTRSFRDFAEKGGFKGVIDWFPIEQFVNAIDKLRQIRQDLTMQIYEITGISDIMRGSSKASETLGAQQLKAQYASVKLQHLQMEVASFVQGALAIKSEIIQNLFDPESIKALANTQFLSQEDQALVDQAIELIKSGRMEYRIEVHADSMAVPEFNAERDGRMAFLRSIAEMMTAAAPILERDPSAGVAMLKVVQWGAASFRTGREIEGVLDQAIRSIQKKMSEPKPPPPPDPKMVELQMKQKMDEQTLAMKQQEFQMKQAQAQVEQQMKQQEMMFEQRLEEMRMQHEQQANLIKAESEARMAVFKAMLDAQVEVIVAKMNPETDEEGRAVRKPQDISRDMDRMLNMMMGMAQTITRPRRRIPHYNNDGDIEYVQEVFDPAPEVPEGTDPMEAIQGMLQQANQPRRSVARRDANGITQVDDINGA